MENFMFSIPTKIFFGKGVAEKAGELAGEFSKKALVIYGGGSVKKNGSYQDVTKSLQAAGIEYEELSGILPNPRIDAVDTGVEICRKKEIGVLIAIGGGSVIDTAKGIAAAWKYEGPAWDIVLDGSLIGECLPIIAVPTMAASGSEMDSGAMLINPDTKDKMGIGNAQLFPKYSLMDPTYTCTIPAKQTAAGAADIMSHIFEVYFSKTPGAYMQDRMMESVLKTVVKYGKKAIDEPDDYEARANLMWASSWGCNGFFADGKIGRRWSVHPIEHQLGAYYDETHGIGLAILTPHWMRYILNDDTVDMFADYGKYVFEIPEQEDRYAMAHAAIDATKELFDSWGIPANLRESGIGLTDDSLFEIMAEKALGPAGMINAYVKLDKQAVIDIYKAAF